MKLAVASISINSIESCSVIFQMSVGNDSTKSNSLSNSQQTFLS
jgi:hypothetical protein